ncbi:hypothetical protein [Actinomadura flavalba]|uniref:hypothetical protein n=1 Tax=Actinomadura flavalba TaxID=1120938 RepID=UPI00039D63AC|nr:hypothetical protein [Actinomadura flavalba]
MLIPPGGIPVAGAPVDDEPKPKRRPAGLKVGQARVLAVAGAIAAAIVIAVALLVPGDGGEPQRGSAAPPPVTEAPFPSQTVPPTGTPSPSGSPSASPSKSPSSRPSASKRPKPPTSSKPKPPKKRPSRPGGGGGGGGGGSPRLAINGSGCQGVGVAGLPRSCSIRLTAYNGTIRWRVTGAGGRPGRVSASGGGTLRAGRSTTVSVRIYPTVTCYIAGRGSGSVSFSPGGSVAVTYSCWRG